MYSGDWEISCLRKAIFLAVAFIFLFCGREILAVSCKDTSLVGDKLWQKGNINCDITFIDEGGSGLKECKYEIKSNGILQLTKTWGCTGGSATFPIVITVGAGLNCRDEGENKCQVGTEAKDNADNIYQNPDYAVYDIDFNAPLTTIQCKDTNCKPETEWYNKSEADVKITFNCTDGTGSGCNGTRYCIGSGSCAPTNIYKPANPPYVDTNGVNYIRFYSTDTAELIEATKSKIVNLDKNKPQITAFNVSPTILNIDTPQTTISWQVLDSGGSHLKHVTVWRRFGTTGSWQLISTVNAPAGSDGPWLSSAVDAPSDGSWWYGIHVEDVAGNDTAEGESGFSVVEVIVDKIRPPKPICDPDSISNVENGYFVDSITVVCTDAESEVTIRYTTDGTAPTVTSSLYTSFFTFTETTNLTVAAWDPAGNRSDTPDNSYTYSQKECEPGDIQTQPCGEGACLGSQSQTCQADWTWPATWGACSTRNTDCGVCCKCSDSDEPLPTYDGTQDTDCGVYNCSPLNRDCRTYQNVQYCKGINDCADANEDCTAYTNLPAGTLCDDQSGHAARCDNPSICDGSRGECNGSGTCQEVDYDAACDGYGCGDYIDYCYAVSSCDSHKHKYSCSAGSCTGSWVDDADSSAGTCQGQICSDTDHCSGDTYYTGKKCSSVESSCSVSYEDIGCCQSSKCDPGYYCQESNHNCTLLPECKVRNETGFGYSNAPEGTDCSGVPGKCCSGVCDKDGVISGSGYHSACRSGPACVASGDWGYSTANEDIWCGSPWEICWDYASCDVRTMQYQCALGYCNNAQLKSVDCTECIACDTQSCGSSDCAADSCTGLTAYNDYPVYGSATKGTCARTCSGETCQACFTDSGECVSVSETCSAAKECQLASNDCGGLTNLKCHQTNDGFWQWNTTLPAETACSDGYDNNCDSLVDGADPGCDTPPTASISLSPSEVNVLGQTNDTLLIDVSGSTDDFGILQVRFSSDNSQDGIVQGSWTGWYDWNASSGDWNATTKIKEWGFALSGDYEVWAEVKDGGGYTDQDNGNVYVNDPPTCSFYSPPISGYKPLRVIFTGAGNDSDGTIVSYQWDFNGDGVWDQTTAVNNTGYTYNTEGTFCAKLRVQDNDGAWSTNTGNCPDGVCTRQITVSGDTNPPTTAIQCNDTACSTGWYAANVKITLSCSDAESGCTATYYCVDQTNTCSPTNSYTVAFYVTTEGTNYVRFYSRDNSDNNEPTKSQTVKLDKTPPPKPSCDPGTSNFVGSITVTCSDAESEVTIRYTTDGTAPTVTSSLYTSFFTFTETTNLTVVAWDSAGNRSDTPDNSYTYTIGDLPDTSITSGPANPTNQTTASFSFTGTNSPTLYQCQLDGAGWSSCTSPKPYTVIQGTHTFQVKAINAFGEDPTPASSTWLVDTTLPVVSVFNVNPTILNIATPTATISWTVTDSGGSYLNHVEVWRAPYNSTNCSETNKSGCVWSQIGSNYNAPANSNSWSSSTTDSPPDGIYWYGVHVLDKAGNMATESSPIKVLVDKTNPSSAVTSPAAGAWFKDDFTATLADSDAGGSGLAASCQYSIVGLNPSGSDCSSGVLSRSCGSVARNVAVGSGSCTVSNICIFEGENKCRVNTQSFDNAGNSSGWQSRDFSIDYTPPFVGEVSPLTARQGVEETFSASLEDNIKITGCWFYIDYWDEPVSAEISFSEVPCQKCQVYASATPLESGDLKMRFACSDLAQNYGWGEEKVVVVVANNPPEFTEEGQPSYSTSPCTSPTTQSDCQVNFTAAATDADGDDLTYTWNFGDGNSSDEQNPSHHYDATDTYAVTVTVSDDRGGIVSEGLTVLVTEPTLSVNLGAVPTKGTLKIDHSGLIELIDLNATTTGTISGTINYYFDCDIGSSDCTSDYGVENWAADCDKIESASEATSYTAFDLCDYSAVGTYIAKVLVERGNGSAQNTTLIEVVENQPPTCRISVPDMAATGTPIAIGVGGSSDSEGAMTTVKFCSDKNPANPNGQCDESWTKEYGWSTPEGDWLDAVSKTMKWSFSQTGSYEVWAEVKDDVNQTASCYDTITITECIPGETKSCTSTQGCSHTLICQSAGNWPSCPTDECSPGATQDCGVAGTQTCSSVCSWGTCIESSEDCTGSLPSCPICQHPECNTVTKEWECQPDPYGTDCSDCKQCNGAGSCIYLCSGTESSCECVSDSCVDCSSYYDPTGPTLGYQGVCSCGDLEIPAWKCEAGQCSCVCWNPYPDLGGDENPPGGYEPGGAVPESPSPPPPEEPCQRDYPQVSIIPYSQSGVAGDTLSYTVSAVNNDSLNCDSSSFSLTKSCLSGWTCSLTLSSLSISPGQSKTTSFSATSPSPPYSRGNYEISVTATNSAVPEYSSTGYGIYQVANNPPTASISCHPQGCDLAVGSCTGYTQTTFCLKNNSTDPDDSSDIKNSIWTITGPVSETSDCSVTGNPLCNWGLLSHFPAGNYSAQLYVEDKLRESDTASQPFTILQEAIADFDCSLVAAEGSWQDCNSLRVSEGEVVFFRDKSTPSQGAAIISWSWQFEDGTPLTSNSASFEVVDAGSGGVTLIINDSAGRSDNVFYQVRVTTPLPEWQEIPPF